MELFEIKMACNTNRFSEFVTMKYPVVSLLDMLLFSVVNTDNYRLGVGQGRW